MDEKEYCTLEKFGTGVGEVRVQRDFKEKRMEIKIQHK
jgi:hypothetical protein